MVFDVCLSLSQEGTTCLECARDFRVDTHLRLHLRQVHKYDTRVQCMHCNQLYSTQLRLQQHQRGECQLMVSRATKNDAKTTKAAAEVSKKPPVTSNAPSKPPADKKQQQRKADLTTPEKRKVSPARKAPPAATTAEKPKVTPEKPGPKKRKFVSEKSLEKRRKAAEVATAAVTAVAAAEMDTTLESIPEVERPPLPEVSRSLVTRARSDDVVEVSERT